MDIREKPHRKHRIELTIEADTMRDMATNFQHLAFLSSSLQIDSGNSISAGANSSYEMRHVVDHHMDHDEYFEQLTAYLFRYGGT